MSEEKVIKFRRLYFKRSRNKRGEECFISKQKAYVIRGEKKSAENNTDIIIVANVGSTPITHSGRWDVSTREMFSGKGFIVTDAEFCADELELDVDFINHKVTVMINGEIGRFKKSDKVNDRVFCTDLSFNLSRKGANLGKVIKALQDKEKFLQLPVAFSFAHFVEHFKRTCEMMEKDYMAINGGYSIPNTPMAEALQGIRK